MAIASLELIQARDAAQRLLDQMGLETYLFEVEPGSVEWSLRVECAAEGGWSVSTLNITKQDLLASADDGEVGRRLLAQWRSRLGECRVEGR